MRRPPPLRDCPPSTAPPGPPRRATRCNPSPSDTTGTYNTPGGYENPSDLYTVNQPNYAIDYTGHRIAVPPRQLRSGVHSDLRITFTPNPSGTTPTAPPVTVTYYLPLNLLSSTSSGNPYSGGWFDPTSTAYSTRLPTATT